MNSPLADDAGTYQIAGKKIARRGFGAIRLTGLGVCGEPENRAECMRVVRRAVELGVQLIDTADSYGPHTEAPPTYWTTAPGTASASSVGAGDRGGAGSPPGDWPTT
ncbi:aldo/keto reductase [Kribbella sp. NPDC003505]|uniref:aldo/keto reductase n=1 Tax=Kribbella sp. NPDC003505 TaxID=3154448 RepID=UPI0033B8CB8D